MIANYFNERISLILLCFTLNWLQLCMMHRHTLCCDKANSCQSDDGTLMGKKMLFDITSSCLICNLLALKSLFYSLIILSSL